MPRSGERSTAARRRGGDGGRLEVVPGVVARGTNGIERDKGTRVVGAKVEHSRDEAEDGAKGWMARA